MEKVIAVNWNKQKDRDRRTLREIAKGNIISNNLFYISGIREKTNEYVCVEISPSTTGAYGREMFFFGAKIHVEDFDKKELKITFPDGEVVLLNEENLRRAEELEIKEGFWGKQLQEQREEETWEE